jgi:hypothetical protein
MSPVHRSVKDQATRPSRRHFRLPTVPGSTLRDFQPLLPAEQVLMNACLQGQLAVLGDGEMPSEPKDVNRVRAEFLGFMLVGGDATAPVHKDGVRVSGAYIQGALDLGSAKSMGNISLQNCLITQRLYWRGLRVSGFVSLAGSRLAGGLFADELKCEGDFFLNAGFKADAEVRLLNAEIGGSLDCSGGQFEALEGDALSADRAVFKGNVYLDQGFQASSPVRLLGARIGGDLACRGGKFNATRHFALSAEGAVIQGNVYLDIGFEAASVALLIGSQIGGDLACRAGSFASTGGFGLHLQGAKVTGAFLLEQTASPVQVNAEHLRVQRLIDDVKSWAKGSQLNGFCYEAFGGMAPTDANARLKWLDKQTFGTDEAQAGRKGFLPQPFRQLQRVLREMGHLEDARQVGVAFESQLRQAGLVGESPPGRWASVAWSKRLLANGFHHAFGLLAGYGYRPMRLLAWMLTVWLVSGLLFWWLALPPRSALAPSNPLVFLDSAVASCQPDRAVNPGNWFLCTPLRGEYATFSPFAYSLDLLLPLVDLGQEKTWGAFVPTPKANLLEELFAHWHWGHVARALAWFQTLFGWICSLLLVAIVSGYSRRSDEG